MLSWFGTRRIEDLRTACELAMSHLEFQVKVHAAKVVDASVPDVTYLVILDTTQQIPPEALLSLRGYLSSAIRASLGWNVDPEHILVIAQDRQRAAVLDERTSREDVLAARLRLFAQQGKRDSGPPLKALGRG